jgi:phosphoglycolate phosphatase-like HAD superfamily hydrolase
MIAVIALSPRDYDAVLFDLDGVLTRTASGMPRPGKNCSTVFSSSVLPRQASRSSPLI